MYLCMYIEWIDNIFVYIYAIAMHMHTIIVGNEQEATSECNKTVFAIISIWSM